MKLSRDRPDGNACYLISTPHPPPPHVKSTTCLIWALLNLNLLSKKIISLKQDGVGGDIVNLFRFSTGGLEREFEGERDSRQLETSQRVKQEPYLLQASTNMGVNSACM